MKRIALRFWALSILMMFTIFVGSCSRYSEPTVETTGDQVKIEFGEHSMIMKKEGNISESDYGMLFGFQLDDVAPNTHAWMSYIDMTVVGQLLSVYPDFYRCSSPGAAKAQSYIQNAGIIAANKDVWNKLTEIDKLFQARTNRVVVKCKGLKLALQEYKRGGQEVNMVGFGSCYLVYEIEYEEKTL